MIKNTLLLVVVFGITTMSLAASKLNQIVAVVNGDVITQHEIDKKMATSHQTKQQALDDLIDSILEIKLAQTNNIQISDAEIKNIIANIAKTNKLSITQLEQELKKTQGLSLGEYKEQIHDQIIINKLEQQLFGKDVQITGKEITQVIAKPIIAGEPLAAPLYHVVDILIETPDNASQAQLTSAQNIAKQFLTKLKNNNIKTVAASFKEVIQYNDLAIRQLNDLPDLFISFVKKMHEGQVVGSIQAPNGLHILKLLEIKGLPQKITLTKEQAYEIVFRKKLKDSAQKLIKELRESAYIKIMN